MQQEAANKLCTVKETFEVRNRMVLPNPKFKRVKQEREVDIIHEPIYITRRDSLEHCERSNSVFLPKSCIIMP